MKLTRSTRYAGIALAVIALLLSTGSQCATDTRHSAVTGYLDFVQATTQMSLQTIFPIADILNALLHPPA